MGCDQSVAVLHVGMPKAASTTLQTWMDAQGENLARLGVQFINGAKGVIAAELENVGSDSRVNWGSTHLWRTVQSWPSGRDVRRSVVISSEGLSLLSAGQIRTLVAELREVWTDVKVLIGIRPPLDAAVSAWQYAVTGGAIEDLYSFGLRFLEELQVPESVNAADVVIRRWMTEEGVRRVLSVRVVGYEGVPGGPLAQALPLLIPQVDWAALPGMNLESAAASNRSPSLLMTEVLRQLNRCGPDAIGLLREHGLWDRAAQVVWPGISQQLSHQMAESERGLAQVEEHFLALAENVGWELVEARYASLSKSSDGSAEADSSVDLT